MALATASAIAAPTSHMVPRTSGQAIAHTVSARRSGVARAGAFQGLRRSGKASQGFCAAPSPSLAASSRRTPSTVCEATGTATSVGAVTDESFKSLVLDSDVPVVVDFWAPWCGPCRMIDPLIAEVAAQFGAKIKVLKLNTDESPATATEYGIRSIPTVMLFKKGKKVDTIIGAVPKNTLTSTIEKYI